MRHFAAVTLIALAACNREDGNATNAIVDAGEPAANVVAPAPDYNAPYLGKWVGPEGLVLDVTARPGGGVAVANQWTLEDKGNFEGSVTAEGLRFMRKGEAVTAARTDGDATGMKWLAGKKDCLTVKAGSEAYCRD